MRPPIRSVLQDFNAAVKPVCSLMDDIRQNAGQALRSQELRSQHETIQCASVVILSGYLETFIRDLSKAFFAILLSNGKGLGALISKYPKFSYLHYRYGAKALEDFVRKNKSSNQDWETFASRLAAPAQNAGAAPLWEAFAQTGANPGPDVINDFLKNLGISDPISGISTEVRGRYSAQTIRAMLQSFIDVRNECAHTGRSRYIPTPTDIDQYVHLLRTLSLGMCKITDKHISNF